VIFSSLEHGQFDLWLLSRPDKRVMPWLVTPFNELGAQFSPDGKWIVYVSDESGQREVYVQRFVQSGEKYVISRGGGHMPSWRHDGREIHYVSLDRKLMAVPVKLEPVFDAGAPHSLFEAHVRTEPVVAAKQYDTHDGEHFLLNRSVGEQGSWPMTLVQNWMEGINR